MRTLTSFTATMLLTHSVAGTASAQITNPLPAPVEKRGLMVEIQDVARLPERATCAPSIKT